jgi:hypothetical protein
MKNFRLLRVLRILRLLRILRVLRVLHLISELRAIVSSIVGSFRSLIWVVVLMLLMMYIVAVFFTQSVTDHLVSLKYDDVERNEYDDAMRDFFGSLGRSILSLWQAITGGNDWDNFAWPLYQQIGFTTGLLFTFFIAFALLALMNVVTGVFVQTALNSAKDEEDEFVTNQIMALLQVADNNSDDIISLEEVNQSLEDPKQSKVWKSIGVQAADARYIFKLLDLVDHGQVSFEEFLGGCLRLSGPAKAVDLLTVMQEGRKNIQMMTQKFNLVIDAMINIHDAVQGSKDDMRRVMHDTSNLMKDAHEETKEV